MSLNYPCLIEGWDGQCGNCTCVHSECPTVLSSGDTREWSHEDQGVLLEQIKDLTEMLQRVIVQRTDCVRETERAERKMRKLEEALDDAIAFIEAEHPDSALVEQLKEACP